MGRQETRQQSAARRRDTRAAKPADAATGSGKRKDTRRWCGGHVGREHRTACFTKATGSVLPYNWPPWYVLACTVCGKELARHWQSAWGKPKPVPAWVTP